MNYPDGVSEFSRLIELKVAEKYDSHASYKPTIGVSIDNNKVTGLTTTNGQLTRLLNRRGLARPYINPRGRGVLQVADAIVEDLYGRYKVYLPICELESLPEEEITLHEIDGIPQAVIGLKLKPSLGKVINWTETNIGSIDAKINSNAVMNRFESMLPAMQQYINDRSNMDSMDEMIVSKYIEPNVTKDESAEAFVLRINASIKSIQVGRAVLYWVSKTLKNKIMAGEEMSLDELDNLLFDEFIPALTETHATLNILRET